MKFSKHIFLLIFAVFLFAKLFSQNDTLQKSNSAFVLKTDILLPVMGLFNIGDFLEPNKLNFSITSEINFKKRNSLQLTVLNVWPKVKHVGYWPSANTEIFTVNVLEIIPEYKFYLSRKKMQKGFYIGAYAKYIRSHTIREEHGPYPYSPMMHLEYIEHETAFGGLAGYQFYIKKKLVIDFLLGLGRAQLFKVDIIKKEYTQFSDDYSGYLDAQFAINIGYKF